MTIQTVLDTIKTIKKSSTNRENYTNYYNKYNNQDMEVDSWLGIDTIVFTVQEEYVMRAFFFTVNLEELSHLLKLIPNGCVIDYICKSLPDELKACFTKSGIVQHAVYARRTLPVPYETDKGDPKYKELMKKLYNPNLGEIATIEDYPSIKKLMLENFDPVNSDIPTSDELLNDIREKTVWVHKVNNEIVTMYVFRITGKRRYGAMTYNRLSADYLYSLVKNAHIVSEKEHPVKWHYGWIDISNKKIIRTLEKEGALELDGTKNYVFLKKEEDGID